MQIVNNGISTDDIVNGLASTNPEDLMIANDDQSFETAFHGVSIDEVVHLANLLDSATVADISNLLVDYRSRMAKPLRDHIAELLVKRVWEATPDELEGIVQEAKAQGRQVWDLVREPLIRRNEFNAERIFACENLPSLELLADSMAKSDGWMPAPVYHAVIATLRKMIPEANMTQLDAISQCAGKYRCRGALLNDIKKRDSQLVRIVSRYEKIQGYVLQTARRHVVIKNARNALRSAESQGWEIL